MAREAGSPPEDLRWTHIAVAARPDMRVWPEQAVEQTNLVPWVRERRVRWAWRGKQKSESICPAPRRAAGLAVRFQLAEDTALKARLAFESGA
jgi:hypothetical protein